MMNRKQRYQSYLFLSLLFINFLAGCMGGIFQIECRTAGSFAFINPDGNVYFYDLEKKCMRQVTVDGRPHGSINPRGEDYYFFDPLQAWSAPRQLLLVGRNFQAFLLDRKGKMVGPYGERVVSAFWSPDGKKLVLVQISPDQEDLEYAPLDFNIITVIDLEDSQPLMSFQGNAPVWTSEHELAYFAVIGKSNDANGYRYHKLFRVNVNSRQTQEYPFTVRTQFEAVRLSQLSSDGYNLAVFVPGGESYSFIGFVPMEDGRNEVVFVEQQVHSLAHFPLPYSTSTDFQLSPVEPILAICLGRGPSSSGKILLLRPDRQPLEIDGGDDRRCRGGMSWNPTGTLLAFIASDEHPHVNFYDMSRQVLVDEPFQKLDVETGIWWSPDGTLIGVAADQKICLAQIQVPMTRLDFECVAEGSSMTWMP